MKKNPLLIALLIYCFFSVATFYSWQKKGLNTVTGDEPHYLIMTSGIVKHGTLEQTDPYRQEFKSREIYKHGLAPENAQPSIKNTHAVLGPNGLFNVHNIGLPLLLAVPFLLGGVIGAKLTMVFLGSLVVVVVWKFSSYFSENNIIRLWAVITTTISLPLIPASNQIYPDVVAGLIALIGLYWFLTVHVSRSSAKEAILATAVVFLPWLQIKFAVSCIVLVFSIAAKIYLESKDIKRIARIFFIACCSCLLLTAYNYYAFGKISGPYQSGALEVSQTSLMVLVGLHFDQNQGFILQNPVNLIGIFAIGALYRFNRTFSIVWALVFLSLILPNALHPNWYGGWSFSGRFQWAAAIVFIMPTIYGLLIVAKRKEGAFKVLIASGVALQLYFFYQYTISGANLYNKGAGTELDDYSIFYYPVQAWMPMLYDVRWAFEYWPNYSWMIVICVLLLLGFLGREISSKKYFIIATSLLLMLFFAGDNSETQQKNESVFSVDQLPSQTGRVVNSSRIAEQGVDKPGFINYGPYFRLIKGNYQVVTSYKSLSEKSDVIGWADVFNASTGKKITQVPIYGTYGVKSEIVIDFEATQWKPNLFEFRTYWNGASNIEVQGVAIKRN